MANKTEQAQALKWRRTTQTAYGHTIFVRPQKRMADAEWSNRLEFRSLISGRIAVIRGKVIEPGTPEAQAAIAQALQVAA